MEQLHHNLGQEDFGIPPGRRRPAPDKSHLPLDNHRNLLQGVDSRCSFVAPYTHGLQLVPFEDSGEDWHIGEVVVLSLQLLNL